MPRLSRKAAIITGGGSGIGRATARLFATEGASVAIFDCDRASADEVVESLLESGLEAHAWLVDVSDGVKLEAAIVDAARTFGRLDILVNNAATYVPKSFEALTRDDWWKVLDTNLTAYFLSARAAAREMRKAGGGSIVNICSVHRLISEPGSGAYAASKGGVAQLTRNLDIEFAIDNILPYFISPGFIRPPKTLCNIIDVSVSVPAP